MTRPLLLVDVDGVISLFGFEPLRPPEGRFVSVDGLPHYLSARAGKCVSALADRFDCVWCTGWEERAEEHLPRLLDLRGGWPHLVFGDRARPGAHWKLAAIDAYAGPDRPLAWIDDAHDSSCRRWAAKRRGATLLVTTAPAIGLTVEQTRLLLTWDPGA